MQWKGKNILAVLSSIVGYLLERIVSHRSSRQCLCCPACHLIDRPQCIHGTKDIGHADAKPLTRAI